MRFRSRASSRKSVPPPLLALLFLLASACLAEDWPQWRGPRRDGRWTEEGLVQTLPSPSIPLKWKVEISDGYAGPCVVQGRVVVMDRLKPPEEAERVLCFDANTGEKLWRFQYPCRYGSISFPAGPRTTPTWDQGKLYTLGTSGHLCCLEAATGKVVWEEDLQKIYDIGMPTWGLSASPLIEGELLILQIGGKPNACIVALDKATGQEVWKALDDPASYSSPIAIDQAGKRVIVCWTDKRLAGLDPGTGQILWEVASPSSPNAVNIATPVVSEDLAFISGFWDGSLLVRLSRTDLTAQEVWRRKGKSEVETDALHCCISTPILQGGYIYGVDSYGQLRCLKADTGDRVWESGQAVPQARWANVHMVQNGSKVWMFNELGELILAELSPAGYVEKSRSRLLDRPQEALDKRGGVCWSHPAFANGCIYARNDREIVCADLRAK